MQQHSLISWYQATLLQWRHRQDTTHLAALINGAASDNRGKRLLAISDVFTPARQQA